VSIRLQANLGEKISNWSYSPMNIKVNLIPKPRRGPGIFFVAIIYGPYLAACIYSLFDNFSVLTLLYMLIIGFSVLLPLIISVITGQHIMLLAALLSALADTLIPHAAFRILIISLIGGAMAPLIKYCRPHPFDNFNIAYLTISCLGAGLLCSVFTELIRILFSRLNTL